jgi:hypothetical protein
VQVYRNVLAQQVVSLLLEGRGAEEERNPWPGVRGIAEVWATGKGFRHPYIQEISSRDEHMGPAQRLDVRLTTTGVLALLPDRTRHLIEGMVWGLAQAAGWRGAVTWDGHIMVVLPGAGSQVFHVDSGSSRFYFTLLFPLTKDPIAAGKTEFEDKRNQPDPPARVGDCMVFDGRKRHRGQANKAKSHVRAFFYVACYSGGNDTN